MFEGLTRINSNGQVLPGLAQSWTRSDDGLTYTFKLRTGVKFHDGTDFNSADVKFTFDRAMAPDSTNAQKWIFAPIESVTASDAATVVIKLKFPVGNFPYNLGWGDAVIFAPESRRNNKTNPVGTGPFKFVNWVRGDRVELAKFDQYRDAGAIKLKRVTFRFIQDPSARWRRCARAISMRSPHGRAGRVDQFKTDKRFKVVVGATEGETILAINNTKSPLSDVRVRRALAHAIDRKAVIDGAWSGYGTPIGSHFSPLHPAYVDLTGMYPYDVNKAKALLREAGFPNGFSLQMRLPPFPYAPRGGEIISAMLSQVGIDAEIELIQAPQWLDASVPRAAIRSDHRRAHGAVGYQHLHARRLLFRLFEAGVQGADDEDRPHARRGRAQQALRRCAAHDRGGLRQRVPVPAAQARRVERRSRRVVGEHPIQANDVTQAYWKK